MSFGNLDMGIIFLTQTVIGLVGNCSLLCFYNYILITRHHLRPTDLILNHLGLANSMVLFFKGIPQTMATFGWKYFLDDTKCKLVFYFHRVGTGMSFSTVCLLNGFQAIKLNPSICRWMELRIRSFRFICFCCFLCWFLHLLMNSCMPVIVNGPLINRNLSGKGHHGYCSWTMQERYSSLYTVLYFSPDLLGLLFMAWASSSMVLVLHRHKQKVQYIHGPTLSHRPSHEARATRTILILVTSFVLFYSIYSILTIWNTLVANPGQWKVNSSVLVASCFPAVSPFVLIISDTRVSQFCFACRARAKWFSYAQCEFVLLRYLNIHVKL